MRNTHNSRYKLHNEELSAKDVIQKKKDTIINNIEGNNKQNDGIKIESNKIISVDNYNTYNSLTKSKYNNVFGSETYIGHNLYKHINETGNISDKNKKINEIQNCNNVENITNTFIGDTFEDMTKYSEVFTINNMIVNEIYETNRPPYEPEPEPESEPEP